MFEPKESERTIEFLARFRPDDEPDKDKRIYRGIPMTADEIAERRFYIRRKLRNSKFNNQTNDALDKCLYYELDGIGMFEDAKGYCYALRNTMRTSEESKYRKARAMIPFEYMGLNTKAFKWDVYQEDTADVKDILNRYIMNFQTMKEKGMGLYIYSSTKGSGKTMLSCCILNEIAERHTLNVKFVNVLDLLDMTKESYRGNESEVDAIRNASVLVLDDIGVQMSKEWVDTVFYKLINKRYNEHKVTIYTSNVTIENLKMDERTKDRIEATSYMVNLPEVPVRKHKSEEEKNRLMDELEKRPVKSGNSPEGK